MLYLFLFLIWVSPALIAGMLGWSGVWGTGSALWEYLVPIPVAGGVLHVPGLVISFLALKILNTPSSASNNTALKQVISYVSFGVFLAVFALHVEIDRIYGWLTSDYQPALSVIRFDSNALFLFSLTDAFWVFVFSLVQGARFTRISAVLLLTVVPITLVIQLGGKALSGPSFEIGGSTQGPQQGQEIQVVYYSGAYDEAAIRAWLGERAYLNQPWHNPNTEHEALVFTNSLQIIKWAKFDDLNTNNTVATVCSYEEDESMFFYKGQHNCFTDKITLRERVEAIQKQQPSGFDTWVDYWIARSTFCEQYEIPDVRYKYDIAPARLCLNLKSDYSRELARFVERYGEDAPEIIAITQRAEELGLSP